MFEATHRIKPGNGYWDATHYPVGGKFQRAPENGLKVETTNQTARTKYGILAKFQTQDGRTVWCDERTFEPLD